MRIVYLSDSVSIKSGFGQQIKALATEMSARGHEQITLCEQISKVEKDIPNYQEFNFAKFDVTGNIQDEINNIKPDAVIAMHGFSRMFALMDSQISKNCPLFVWFPYESSYIHRAHNQKFINAEPDTIVFMSEYNKDLWKGLTRSEEVIPHIVTDEWVRPSKSRDDLREEWSQRLNRYISPSKTLVGNFNRNLFRKNWDSFFEICAILEKRAPGAFQFLAHTNLNPNVYDLQELEAAYGLKGKMTYTGFEVDKGFTIEDLCSLYSMCDYRVDTSGGEGFGLTVAECAALEIPQIVTDHTCMWEILGPDYPLIAPANYAWSQRGFFARPDVSAYADAIQSGLQTSKLFKTSVPAAKKHVKENFTAKRVADMWEDLIDRKISTTNRASEYKFGLNGKFVYERSAIVIGQACAQIGGKAIELLPHDSKIVDACLYFGADIDSYTDHEFEKTTRSEKHIHKILFDKHDHTKWPKGKTLLLTECEYELAKARDNDEFNEVMSCTSEYEWIIFKPTAVRPWKSKIDITTEYMESVLSRYHVRRKDLEAVLGVQYNGFAHQVWGKTMSVNPFAKMRI